MWLIGVWLGNIVFNFGKSGLLNDFLVMVVRMVGILNVFVDFVRFVMLLCIFLIECECVVNVI